jgi:hypothetical protein
VALSLSLSLSLSLFSKIGLTAKFSEEKVAQKVVKKERKNGLKCI